ncbi:MAG: hypothetical protein L3K19_02710 [Thermoplasmata archaeon]|nr:hypothetical protein [Thermoplasmata archaeon]
MSVSPPEAAPRPAPLGFWQLWKRLQRAGNRPYLVASLLLVLFAVTVLLQTYQAAPVPPGFDSADWTQRSYGFVGLPHPPVMAVGSPYVYPPLIFPFLGILARLTQSALFPGFIFASLMLVGFGLTTIHLSRRLLATGPAQVGFVAAALLNGTTLSMLYWGGYPNFMAFLLVNEAFVCLIGFLRTQRRLYAVGMWGFVALTYLDHTLTFALLAAELVFGWLLVSLFERGARRLVFNRGNLAGIALLAGTVAVYTAVTSVQKISHASYLYSNPAAYPLNNIGQIFLPLGSEPAFWPAGAPLYLSVDAAIAVLLISSVLVLVPLLGARWKWPRLVSTEALLAGGWLVTCLAVPVLGWYAHVDTVYNRFLYYLPVPLALMVAVVGDRWILERNAHIVPAGSPIATTPPSAPPEAGRTTRRGTIRSGWGVDVGLFVVVVLLISTVTLPTATRLERIDTGLTHDQFFLQAMHALKGNPQTGSVLAAASVVRWTEALTDRGAYEIGPTWLLFFPWQITNVEETYFALNGQGAITNNEAAFSYSGLGAPGAVPSTPMYSVLYEGINFPVFRVLPSTLNVSVQNGSGTVTRTASLPGGGALQLPDAAGGAQLTFNTAGTTVNETTALGAGGAGWLNFSVNPASGSPVTALSFSLAGFAASTQLVNPSPVTSGSVDGSSLFWNLSAGVGPLPDPVPVSTVATMTPAPSTSALNLAAAVPTATLRFADPVPGAPFHVSLALRTGPTSNPAVQLPRVLNTSSFLASYDIHFVLLPNKPDYLPTAHLFTQGFGFRTFFVNSEWLILQG